MIKNSTILKVKDNSSIQKAQCIKIIGGSVKKTASVGDLIIFAVKSRAWVEGEDTSKKVYLGIVSSVKKKIRRNNGFYYQSPFNTCVALNKNKEPIGTIIYGPVGEELWKQKIHKLTKMAEMVF